jgi:nitroimidazol reductase NimA-like FMN-containing flavoprotein (pyridoxamine 5'-phosphate oxidase superfamily)
MEGTPTMQPNEIAEVLNRPLSQELLARDLTRLAYIAKDGTPRSVPIGFTWNGTEIVMCTAKNAAKVSALRHNPAVALTIDTEVHPPQRVEWEADVRSLYEAWSGSSSPRPGRS